MITNIPEWLDSWEDEYLNATLHAMREMVLSFHPEIVESFKWKVPYYEYKGHLLYISVLKKKTPYFSFAHGFQLPDESGAFSGLDKKAVRYLEVNPKEDMDVELIYTYLQDALNYNETHPNMKFGQIPNI